jgi:hypothetical protein
METPRRILAPITADLHGKMVLLAGARQMGKTTLAKQVLAKARTGLSPLLPSRARRDLRLCQGWDPLPPRRAVLRWTAVPPRSQAQQVAPSRRVHGADALAACSRAASASSSSSLRRR